MTKLSQVRPDWSKAGYTALLCPQEREFDSELAARNAINLAITTPGPGRVLVIACANGAVVRVDVPESRDVHLLAMCLGSRLAFMGPQVVVMTDLCGEKAVHVAAQTRDGHTHAVTVSGGVHTPTSGVDSDLFESFWEGVKEDGLDAEDEQ